MNNDWKSQLSELKLKNVKNNLEMRKALEKWNDFASSDFDTRSAPKAAELFQEIAKKYQGGRVMLALIFYELFMEFGELPRKNLFEEDLYNQVENASKTLGGKEREIVDWFLTELRRRE